MTWLDTARRIVERHQYEVVDPETGESVEYVWKYNDTGWEPIEEIVPKVKGGVLFDATSANLMVQIHDHLNETNRARFAAMPLLKAQDMAMKLVAKQRGA